MKRSLILPVFASVLIAMCSCGVDDRPAPVRPVLDPVLTPAVTAAPTPAPLPDVTLIVRGECPYSIVIPATTFLSWRRTTIAKVFERNAVAVATYDDCCVVDTQGVETCLTPM